MSGRLLIHAGAPKTGTTSLQNFFKSAREELKKYNWDYIDFSDSVDENYRNRLSEANGIVFRKDCTPMSKFIWEESDEDSMSRWRCIIDRVKSHLQSNNVLISLEGLFGCFDFFNMLRKEVESVEIVVYLRRQDRWIESNYNQHVKFFRYKQDFQEFIEYFDAEYYSALKGMEEIVGKKNLIVRVFEKEQFFEGNLYSDFLNVLGINSNNMVMRSKNLNIALKGNYFDLMLWVNRYVEGSDYELFYNTILKLNNTSDENNENEGFMNKEERIKLLDKFRGENQKIAERYLGKVGEDLFLDKSVDIPKHQMNSQSLPKDMFCVLQEVDNIKRLIDAISRFCLIYGMQNTDRKLCLFGAGYIANKVITKYNLCVEMIVDNDSNKEGTFIKDIPVVHTEKVNDWKKYFVVIASIHSAEISEQLKSKNLISGVDFIFF